MSTVPSPEIGDRVVAGLVPAVALTVAGVGRGITHIIAAAGASDSIIAYGGTTVAVLGFAGLLVRQLVQSSGAWKEIVSSLRSQLLAEQEAHEFTRWEREQARFRAGERDNPGLPPSSTLRSTAP